MKYLLILISIISLSNCKNQKKILSEDLKICNLRGPVKSHAETTYKIDRKTDSLKLHKEGIGINLYYSLHSFKKQKLNEVSSGVSTNEWTLGFHRKFHYDKRGNLKYINYPIHDGTVVSSYQTFPDGITRVVKIIEKPIDTKEEIKERASYKYNLERCLIIKNEKDTTILHNCKRKNSIKFGKDDDYIEYDSYNRLITKTVGNPSNFYKDSFFYTDLGYPEKETHEDNTNNIYTKEYQFDSDTLSSITHYFLYKDSKRRKLLIEEKFRYDDLGNMIIKSEKSFQGGYDHFYKLEIKKADKFNNWILAEIEISKNEKYVLKRQIEYY